MMDNRIDAKIASQQEYALKLLQASTDRDPDSIAVSTTTLPNLALDLAIGDTKTRFLRIILDALGNADVTVRIDDGKASVQTGSGNDTISVEAAWATVQAGAGDDRITVKTSGLYAFSDGMLVPSVDLVRGEAGKDIINVSSHGLIDRTEGGEGDDVLVISGNGSVDRTDGGSGNDRIFISNASGIDWGMSGINRTEGGDGDDEIYLRSENDVFIADGGDGNDKVFVEAQDTVWYVDGGEGDDDMTIRSLSAAFIDGGHGDDTIHIAATATYISGGKGNDHLILDTPGGRATVDMFEGDGHDLVEINGTLEIRRNGIDGAALSESDISVAKNDDGTVSVKFPGSDDALTAKFTGAAAEATGFDVELAGSSLIITPKTEAGIV